jgi:hypothetical protein
MEIYTEVPSAATRETLTVFFEGTLCARVRA